MNRQSLPFLSFLSGAAALDKMPALCDDSCEKWILYGDLREAMQALIPFWRRAGRGLVLCSLPRTAQGAIAALSATAAGHAIFFIDSAVVRLPPFIAAYEPEWIVSTSNARPGDLYSREDWPEAWLLRDLVLWRRAMPADGPLHPDLLYLFMPKGPEGSLRTVRLSYANLESNVTAASAALGCSHEDRAILTLPLSYSFGLSVLLNLLAVGGSVLLTEVDIKSRAFWELAERREATLFAGVPMHYDYIARAGLEHLRAPRLKTFWQAGGRMPTERLQELLKQIAERKGQFFVLFGQTEASPRISVCALHETPEKIGSSGRVLPGGALKVENDEIIYEGPNVMMGYAENRIDLARGDDSKGRLPTGERGFIDEDGFLFLIS